MCTRIIVIKVFILFILLNLSACGSMSLLNIPKTLHDAIITAPESDKAPSKQIDVSKIPNAIPKDEPKSRYGNPKSYVVFGKRYYVMESNKGFVEKGIASWYGTKFHGRRTSSGETYDMYGMTAAHKSLPLPTYVEVINLKNNKKIIVKINDRGPFHENRIIDLSYTAAIKLDILKNGTGLVEIRVIGTEQIGTIHSDERLAVINTAVTKNEGRFYIQVGSFSNLINAEDLKQKLKSIGQGMVSIIEVVVSESILYRVKIGPFTDIDQADAIVSSLVEHNFNEHHIVIN
ncbi:MAG: septal ring lytic transglycosylase RlpA family lipoprotein [Legionellales bacterium]|nr:septal ring lytic transglycosylase RlpA family lipoprotein [Legionellales bacterium]